VHLVHGHCNSSSLHDEEGLQCECGGGARIFIVLAGIVLGLVSTCLLPQGWVGVFIVLVFITLGRRSLCCPSSDGLALVLVWHSSGCAALLC
jgi:hypothetical protein